jgi:ATP-dependent helicase/nuclease subunit A
MQELSISISQGYTSWWDALQANQSPLIQKAARYLEHWRVLGEALPVHDLLDLIYHESNLRIQYAITAQNLARAQVLANLDAFLELALNQDGGRYPSLSRFIDEINAMRQGDDDETPDEGDVEAEAASEANEEIGEVDVESEMSEEERHRRVRLMTIHGAKGLEAPFIIMLDANSTEWRQPHRGVLLDWSPEDPSPRHLSLYTSASLTGERSTIFKKENEVSQNENWNLLYVAMTRAKQGLWLSGVDARTKTGINERSWYGRALAAGLNILDVAVFNLPNENHQADEIKQELGSMPFKMDHFDIVWDAAAKGHRDHLAKIESGALAEESTVTLLERAKEEPDPELLQEGTNFHRLLEFLIPDSGNQAKPPMPSEQELINWMDIDQAQAKDLILRAKTVLATSELKPYIALGEWVAAWNELDIATADGKGYRIDRLVEFDDHLAILDYKLSIPQKGSLLHQKYLAQLQIYQAQLSRIREDKPSKAYLVSATGELVEINATP